MTVAVRDLEAAIARASSAVTEKAILETLDVLMAVPAPPGRERALAERVVAWGKKKHGDLEWDVDVIDDASANAIARASHGKATRTLALYSHLDTSLTGEAEHDFAITGESNAPARFDFEAASREIRGFGVGIARAPSAAAIVVLAAACEVLRATELPHRVELLLAAGGTHRAAGAGGPPSTAGSSRPAIGDAPSNAASHAWIRFGRGVAHALARGWKPDAVLNVKGGPPGVLHEEPTTAYFRVVLRSRWTAALVRAKVAPDGGLIRRTGAVMDAIEAWRWSYLAAHPPTGQLTSEIVIGAVRGGSGEKADLIPGYLEVSVYAILGTKEDPARVAAELADFLKPRLRDIPGAPSMRVEAYASAPGGATDPSSEIVSLAQGAWRAHRRSDPSAITGWTGATDGGVLMAAGIPVARMGAYVKRDSTDPRTEIVSMDELLASARAWTDVVIRYAASPAR